MAEKAKTREIERKRIRKIEGRVVDMRVLEEIEKAEYYNDSDDAKVYTESVLWDGDGDSMFGNTGDINMCNFERMLNE